MPQTNPSAAADTASFGTRTFNFLIGNIDQNITNYASKEPLPSGYIYDTSEGSARNDIFMGSQGNDTLTGNGGQDIFALPSFLDWNDTPTDFALNSNNNNNNLNVQNPNKVRYPCEILYNKSPWENSS